jgi:hypothetical protein
MTKTLDQIIFFFLHQNQNIFFSNIGNQNIQVKWSFPYSVDKVRKNSQQMHLQWIRDYYY